MTKEEVIYDLFKSLSKTNMNTSFSINENIRLATKQYNELVSNGVIIECKLENVDY